MDTHIPDCCILGVRDKSVEGTSKWLIWLTLSVFTSRILSDLTPFTQVDSLSSGILPGGTGGPTAVRPEDSLPT